MTTDVQGLLGQIRQKASRIIVVGNQGRPERCMELGAEITDLVTQIETALSTGTVEQADPSGAYDLAALPGVSDDPEPEG